LWGFTEILNMESIYKKLVEIEKGNDNVAIATVIKTEGSTPRKAGAKMIIYPDKKTYGTVGGGKLENQVIEDAIKVIKENNPELFHHKLEKDHKMGCGGCVDVFIEPIVGNMKLYIFGGGHVGSVLADLAEKLGFTVSIIDCREEIINNLNKDKFNCVLKPYEEAVDNLIFDNNTFITIMTHGHNYDQLLTEQCAKKDFAYLGMIGSKNKIAKFRKHYTDNKLLTDEQMLKIDWPMGIPISCQTPEEIAVSILAKLVDVRGKISK
jgi:xanthine dehydrogenase accessory factor